MATVIQPPTAAQIAKICGNDQSFVMKLLQLFGVQGLFPGLVVYSAAQPVGGVLQVNGQTIALPASGASVLRQAYQALFNAIVWVSGVTISHAAPGVVAWVANGLGANVSVYFTTNDALPSPLVAGTEYFVKTPGTDSFTVSATAGGAVINTTTDGSGTHTATAYPQGRGDGTTTFGTPTVAAVSPGVNAYVVV